MAGLITRLAAEAGVAAIRQSSRDVWVLFAQRFVRLFAYGASFLVLVPFLASLGISDSRIGLFMTMTLLGDTAISVLLAAVTDRLGRRRVLAAGAALMTTSGLVFALASTLPSSPLQFWLLLIASIVGVISPSGNEIGPFRAVEESILAHLTPVAVRSDVFAWYTLGGTAGTALGSLASGWVVQIMAARGHDDSKPLPLDRLRAAHRVIFLGYAAIGVVKLALSLCLSKEVELDLTVSHHTDRPSAVGAETGEQQADEETSLLLPSTRLEQKQQFGLGSVFARIRRLFPHISPASRRILRLLLLLFALDSFGSGMASPSWITYFFVTVHNLAPALLGTLFLVTNILAALSNLAALPLARRLGPLRTMVFTHLPSALFLALVPLPSPSSSSTFAGGTPLAMAFLALRACTQSMDQAPRQAFLAAAVLPAERTAVMGVVNMLKTLTQAGGVGFAGVLAQHGWWVTMLGGAGALKASYDLLMLWSFSRLQAREAEEAAAAAAPTAEDEEETGPVNIAAN